MKRASAAVVALQLGGLPTAELLTDKRELMQTIVWVLDHARDLIKELTAMSSHKVFAHDIIEKARRFVRVCLKPEFAPPDGHTKPNTIATSFESKRWGEDRSREQLVIQRVIVDGVVFVAFEYRIVREIMREISRADHVYEISFIVPYVGHGEPVRLVQRRYIVAMTRPHIVSREFAKSP